MCTEKQLEFNFITHISDKLYARTSNTYHSIPKQQKNTTATEQHNKRYQRCCNMVWCWASISKVKYIVICLTQRREIEHIFRLIIYTVNLTSGMWLRFISFHSSSFFCLICQPKSTKWASIETKHREKNGFFLLFSLETNKQTITVSVVDRRIFHSNTTTQHQLIRSVNRMRQEEQKFQNDMCTARNHT